MPEDLRTPYLLLRNAGMLPDEMMLRKEMVSLEALVDACRDPEERVRLRSDLNARMIRYQILMERPRPRAEPAEYRGKLLARLAR